MKEINEKQLNNKHIELLSNALDGVEMILDGLLSELRYYDDSYLMLSKNSTSVFDFVISSILKIQKGHRLALNMDAEKENNIEEPEINIIEGLDISKV